MQALISFRHRLPKGKGIFFFLLFLSVFFVIVSQAAARSPGCDINELRLNSGVGWEYLAQITAECGMENPNNMEGQLSMLGIPFEFQLRAIARQVDGINVNRFSILLVAGEVDIESGEFVPYSIVAQVSNLLSSQVQSDPLAQLGQGFFVLKLDLDGNIKDGFRYRGGRNTHLSLWEGETVKNYLLDFWEDYFDTADFIHSSEGLDR
ncbi:MAG: hypothetical protein ACE5FU_00935 [Nitrospinota bacterium]